MKLKIELDVAGNEDMQHTEQAVHAVRHAMLLMVRLKVEHVMRAGLEEKVGSTHPPKPVKPFRASGEIFDGYGKTVGTWSVDEEVKREDPKA